MKIYLTHSKEFGGDYYEEDKIYLCANSVMQYLDKESGDPPEKICLRFHEDNPDGHFVCIRPGTISTFLRIGVYFPEDTNYNIGGYNPGKWDSSMTYESFYNDIRRFLIVRDVTYLYVEIEVV